ncbi:MAG TPA: permease [Verrucomicrobiae bacterium]|nr:permease [Verrucomicrobiae bacterium]
MNWLWHSLYATAAMLWETLWALVLGFSLSAFLQVFLRNEQITKHFGQTNLRSVGLATFFGAVSSSCSYAAAAAAKTAFKKGAALVPALAFMFASTNLVLELGFILWLLLGWTFLLAEIVGAFILIAVMWLLVKWTLPKGLLEEARAHNDNEEKSGCHSHEHGMKMPDEEMAEEPFGQKIRRGENWAHVADAFVMEVSMLWKEIIIGFLIAGLLMALVPDDWWKNLFITRGASSLRLIENAIVGPLIAIASFVCSVGNIPLAGLLWSSGISFGGVISFIYADLIIIPLILIYRKYYGAKTAFYITVIMFVSMVIAGVLVDLLFGALGLISEIRPQNAIAHASFRWNYTTWLDFVAIALSAGFALIHFKKRTRHEHHR